MLQFAHLQVISWSLSLAGLSGLTSGLVLLPPSSRGKKSKEYGLATVTDTCKKKRREDSSFFFQPLLCVFCDLLEY